MKGNKVKFHAFALLSIFFLFISFASAFQLNEVSQITTSCSGFNCSLINITVYDSDSLRIINNQRMTFNSYYANYSFTPTKTGTYLTYYSDGTNSSSGSFDVTPTGNKNTATFLFVFLSIIILTFALGITLKNNWIMFFAFLEILFFGFFVLIYGIDIFKDVTTTRAIGFILWGIAIIGLFKSTQGMIEEGGWK